MCLWNRGRDATEAAPWFACFEGEILLRYLQQQTDVKCILIEVCIVRFVDICRSNGMAESE